MDLLAFALPPALINLHAHLFPQTNPNPNPNPKPQFCPTPSSTLSPRGTAALQPVLSYFHLFLSCLMNPCHPKTNPAGLIALCVAENKLPKGRNLFSARLQTAAATGSTFLDSTSFEYNSMTGLESLRTAVASIFANHFLPPTPPQNKF